MHEKDDFNFSDRNVPLLEAKQQFCVEDTLPTAASVLFSAG